MERFQIKEEKIKVLTVRVIKATGVKVDGFQFGDWTPDPYVVLRVQTSPNSKQRTTTKDDKVNPIWNEDFKFYLNPTKSNTLELTMMDEDYLSDDKIATKTVNLDDLAADEKETKKIHFNKTTELEISLLITYDGNRELRLNYDLCDEEKDYLKIRKQEIFKKMSKLNNLNQVPSSANEVPTIAIMGSGGGYRAACGLSGVFVALQEEGILDCSTYVTGLSGSSWYISSLYTREGWPCQETCQEMADDLRKRFGTKGRSHIHLLDFKKRLEEKRRRGQLVRLTDFFGMAIGDALLQNQESKLSYQKGKIKHGQAPLPITTGIRVRKDLPASEFSEWVEFSPFEYGIAKYGVFGRTKDFGGKYYKGQLVKRFEESPLHYLQGIWGSAFGIILSTLKDGKKAKTSEEETKKELEKIVLEEGDLLKGEEDDSEDEDEDLQEEDRTESKDDNSMDDEDEVQDSFWLTQALKPSNIFATRKGKAAETFNIFRGLQFKRENDEDFTDGPGKDKTMCIVDSGIAFNSPFPAMLRPERKVELILSFDFSQRDGGDKELPFKELYKAEQWAKDHGLPFPQIKGNPIIEELAAQENPEIDECYVFEDKTDVTCPTILHFPLVNKSFRKYLTPDLEKERKTDEEKDFANFDIFDDPKEPYSSFTFEYENRTFDRLHELMKFNTLMKMPLIKEKITHQVVHRRNNPQFDAL